MPSKEIREKGLPSLIKQFSVTHLCLPCQWGSFADFLLPQRIDQRGFAYIRVADEADANLQMRVIF